MNKIKFEYIGEDEISITIDNNVPLEMVEQLTKNLEAKGMVEDKINSSITHRVFYRPVSKVDDLADELIKSLIEMAKGSDDSPYSKDARMRTAERNRINDRRAKTKLPSVTDAQVAANKSPQKQLAPKIPSKVESPISSGKVKTLFDPDLSGKVNYKKSEDEDEDEIDKSDYGVKGTSLYNHADNARRKAKNVEPIAGIGPNKNAKQYSSAKFSGMTPQTDPKLKKPQPVKTAKDLAPNVLAEIEARHAAKMKKSSWGQHLPFPSAEEEIMKLAKRAPVDGETAAANQLMNLMAGKQMLGEKLHPAIRAQFAAPPSQPTNEQLFGHLEVTEEMAKAAEQKWNGAAFDWLKEAQKPISQKFASEEEELAYWDNIRVSDRDDGKPGY